MKKIINDVIVVEGTGDISHLSTYIDALFIQTNGYEIPKEEIDFLTHLPKNKKIIILTDSDEAGENIRKRLNSLLTNVENVRADIDKCHKKDKHGVAECEEDEILRVLSPYFTDSKPQTNLTSSTLLKLGIDSQKKRHYLCQQLHLGKCNNKSLLKRLNFLQIDEGTIKEALKGYGN